LDTCSCGSSRCRISIIRRTGTCRYGGAYCEGHAAGIFGRTWMKRCDFGASDSSCLRPWQILLLGVGQEPVSQRWAYWMRISQCADQAVHAGSTHVTEIPNASAALLFMKVCVVHICCQSDRGSRERRQRDRSKNRRIRARRSGPTISRCAFAMSSRRSFQTSRLRRHFYPELAAAPILHRNRRHRAAQDRTKLWMSC
jgi:hypothetical protein